MRITAFTLSQVSRFLGRGWTKSMNHYQKPKTPKRSQLPGFILSQEGTWSSGANSASYRKGQYCHKIILSIRATFSPTHAWPSTYWWPIMTKTPASANCYHMLSLVTVKVHWPVISIWYLALPFRMPIKESPADQVKTYSMSQNDWHET